MKIYALEKKLIQKINELKQPFSLNSLAEIAVIEDETFIKKTVLLIKKFSERRG